MEILDVLAVDRVDLHPLIVEAQVPLPAPNRLRPLEEELAEQLARAREGARVEIEGERESRGCGDDGEGACDRARQRVAERAEAGPEGVGEAARGALRGSRAEEDEHGGCYR